MDKIGNSRNILSFGVKSYEQVFFKPDVRCVCVNFFKESADTPFAHRVIEQAPSHKLKLPKHTPKTYKLTKGTTLKKKDISQSVYLAHVNANNAHWMDSMKDLDGRLIFDIKHKYALTFYLFDIDNIKALWPEDHKLFALFCMYLNENEFFFPKFIFTTYD